MGIRAIIGTLLAVASLGGWLRAGDPVWLETERFHDRGGWTNDSQFIDQVENLAVNRAKRLFGAEHANVQPHSGSQANTAVYLAQLEPGDTVLGMDLTHGGHLTHGLKLNLSGRLFHFRGASMTADVERRHGRGLIATVTKSAFQPTPGRRGPRGERAYSPPVTRNLRKPRRGNLGLPSWWECPWWAPA